MCISHEIASWERTNIFFLFIYIYIPTKALKHVWHIPMIFPWNGATRFLTKWSKRFSRWGLGWANLARSLSSMGIVGKQTINRVMTWVWFMALVLPHHYCAFHGKFMDILMEIMIHEDKTVLPLGSRVPYLQTNPDPAWMVVSSYGEPPFPSGFLLI